MREIELKFRDVDVPGLEAQLEQMGARREPQTQHHEDVYFQHPCRDFRVSGEALRVRRIDGRPHITYKGPKESFGKSADPSESAEWQRAVKVRLEMEWALHPGDADGQHTETLLRQLGFVEEARVIKDRRRFHLRHSDWQAEVVLDDVEGLGVFAEVELLVEDHVDRDLAVHQLRLLTEQLGLARPEPRSYLRMVLESRTAPNPEGN